MKLTIQHCILVGILAFSSARLGAATRTWDGEGNDGSFSNAANWDGPVPISNTDILQAGANLGSTPIIGFDSGGEFRTPSFTFLGTATTAYSVRAGSFSDFLTLTNTGSALVNSSPVRQDFTLITITVSPATQTWDGGLQGFVLAQIDLGNSHTLTIDGGGLSATTRNELSGGITGTGTSGLTKTGAGTLLFNSTTASDYTGPTSLLSGKLQLGRDNQIPDGSKLVVSGGTFDTGGFDDTMGVLSLGGSATIDFGTTNTADLKFAASQGETWAAGTLNIQNFTVGADTFQVGTDANALTPAQVAAINFNGTPAMITSTGFVLPIPEPGVLTILTVGGGCLASLRRRSKR